MSLPGTLLYWLDRQFKDDNGVPLALGSIKPLVTATSTPKALYADAALSMPLSLPSVALDAAGRVTAFMDSGGYDFEVYDANSNLLYTVEGVEDPGRTFLASIGNQFASGPGTVTDGYTVLSTDQFVEVDSSAGATTINLLAAADYGLVLTIKNMGANTVAVTPDGAETIDTVASAFTLPAASSPTFPSIVLLSDGISNWKIQASHGL